MSFLDTVCHRLVAAALLLMLVSPLCGQQREVASWNYLALSKGVGTRWNLAAQTELRTGENFESLYLWYVDGNARYTFNRWFAASVGFDYIKIHSAATATRGDVWRTDWRPYISIIPSFRLGQVRSSYNLAWTYNWMPETSVDGVSVHGKAFHLLRHRLSFDYPIANTRFTPYVRAELRHTDKLERVRGTLGTSIRVNAHASFDVAYVYQDKHLSTKTHALSLGYRIRL